VAACRRVPKRIGLNVVGFVMACGIVKSRYRKVAGVVDLRPRRQRLPFRPARVRSVFELRVLPKRLGVFAGIITK
jgi:hypothetical protein